MSREAKRKSTGIRRLKNEAPKILSEVREQATEYVVTHRGKPVAVIRPWSGDDEMRTRSDQVREILSSLDEVARRVAARAGRRTAATAVSGQRR